MRILKFSPTAIGEAVKIIKSGGVIIGPSDTVYGIYCDAADNKAVEKIFKIKKRPKTKPLGVFVKNIAQVKKIAIVDSEQEKFLRKNLPGKLTAILKKRPNLNLAKLVGTKNTIGIRIIKNKFINELLDKFGKPLAQTSANISSRPATTKISEVLSQFKNSNILVIDAGDLPKNKPSAIIDLSDINKKFLRK